MGQHEKGLSKHKTRPAAEDETRMINDLLTIRPFNFKPKRHHPNFEGTKPCSSRYMKANEFYAWVAKHKNQMTVFTSECDSDSDSD